MSEINDPLAWVEKAEEDFLLAQSALRRKKPLVTGACFHAQQCAEKYMKALLVSRKAGFPMTHDLLLLNNLCSNVGGISGSRGQAIKCIDRLCSSHALSRRRTFNH